MSKIRIFNFLFLLFIVSLFSSCGNGENNHAKGYDAGRNGSEKDQFLYSWDKSYKRGYDEGEVSHTFYFTGCGDVQAGKVPDFDLKDNPDYMDGYKECRR